MKRNVVIFVVIIFLALGLLIGFKCVDTNNTITASDEETSQDQSTDIETETNTVQTIDIYIGMYDNFTTYSFDIDTTQNRAQIISSIVAEIGNLVGYSITLLDITDYTENIMINFSSTSAPFDTIDTYTGTETYLDTEVLAYTIFDSIKETINKLYGTDIGVWYLLENNEVYIDSINLYLGSTMPYQGSQYYI